MHFPNSALSQPSSSREFSDPAHHIFKNLLPRSWDGFPTSFKIQLLSTNFKVAHGDPHIDILQADIRKYFAVSRGSA